MKRSLLLALLDGAIWATCVRNNGRPGRIALPSDPRQRDALVDAHLAGEPAKLRFHARGAPPWTESVRAVRIVAYCPADDGLCRWIAIDLDAGDHGARGLADPAHAMRCIAERADAAGLADGLLANRSGGGCGRHLWLIPPAPCSLADGVLAVAALAAAASRIGRDADKYPFARADGTDAALGDPGAIEFYPRQTRRPAYGWGLALPCAGAAKRRGGGILVDAFDDRPIAINTVPRSDAANWNRFLCESRRRLEAARERERIQNRFTRRRKPPLKSSLNPLAALERSRSPYAAMARSLLAGTIAEGERNHAVYAAALRLYHLGVPDWEVEAIVMQAALAAGLPEREARATLRSARKAAQK